MVDPRCCLVQGRRLCGSYIVGLTPPRVWLDMSARGVDRLRSTPLVISAFNPSPSERGCRAATGEGDETGQSGSRGLAFLSRALLGSSHHQIPSVWIACPVGRTTHDPSSARRHLRTLASIAGAITPGDSIQKIPGIGSSRSSGCADVVEHRPMSRLGERLGFLLWFSACCRVDGPVWNLAGSRLGRTSRHPSLSPSTDPSQLRCR